MIFGEELYCFFSIIIHAGMSSVFTVLLFLLVASEVWTPSGGLLSLTHSCIPSGLLAHLAVLQGVLFRQHFLYNLPRENLCFKLFTQSYSFSDMTVVSSGSPAGDIPNVSSVMFLTDFLLPF